MPIRHAVWKVGEKPVPLRETSMGTEALLKTMIVRDPSILSERWLLIGRQVRTTHGGVVNLLALNPDGHVVGGHLMTAAIGDGFTLLEWLLAYDQSVRDERVLICTEY